MGISTRDRKVQREEVLRKEEVGGEAKPLCLTGSS
jgi:hypothetical protein